MFLISATDPIIFLLGKRGLEFLFSICNLSLDFKGIYCCLQRNYCKKGCPRDSRTDIFGCCLGINFSALNFEFNCGRSKMVPGNSAFWVIYYLDLCFCSLDDCNLYLNSFCWYGNRLSPQTVLLSTYDFGEEWHEGTWIIMLSEEID